MLLFFEEKLFCRQGGGADEAVLTVERREPDIALPEAGIILCAPLREQLEYIAFEHIAERHNTVRCNNRRRIRDRLCKTVRAPLELRLYSVVA